MDKEKIQNWVSINLPEGCLNICISFDREIAQKQIEEFGAKPLYGFEDRKRGLASNMEVDILKEEQNKKSKKDLLLQIGFGIVLIIGWELGKFLPNL